MIGTKINYTIDNFSGLMNIEEQKDIENEKQTRKQNRNRIKIKRR